MILETRWWDVSLILSVVQPEFVVQPESQTVEEGQTVTMDCTAIGEPTPTMSWMKDGEILRSEDRLSILPNNTLR